MKSVTSQNELYKRTLPVIDDKNKTFNTIELFAGAAGLAQGFERAGSYQAIALYDIAKAARDSYLAYDQTVNYKLTDIRELKRKSINNVLDGRTLHGILGGPPCQGFSMAGKRDKDADTNQLIKEYAKIVNRHKPSFLVMENVPQLLFHPLFVPLFEKLDKHYRITYGILNAARYGAPQTRHRLILIAYHRKFRIQPTLPVPTHGQRGQILYAYHLTDSSMRVELNETSADAIFGADPVIRKVMKEQTGLVSHEISKKLAPLVTVGDAIDDLCKSVGENTHTYSSKPTSDYQRLLRGNSKSVGNCVARKHVGEPLRIAKTLREGGTPSRENGKSKKRYYSQAYARLHRDGLARTLTTYFQNAGSGRFLHYQEPRTLTIREAARLQGFSDTFNFYGSLMDQMQLVGNAVPLPLAEAIGKHVIKELGNDLPD